MCRNFSIQWDWCKGKPTVENPTFHGRMAMVSFDVPETRPLKYGLNWATNGVFTHYGRVYSKGKETGWFLTSNIEGCCRFYNQFGKCRSGLIGYFWEINAGKKRTHSSTSNFGGFVKFIPPNSGGFGDGLCLLRWYSCQAANVCGQMQKTKTPIANWWFHPPRKIWVRQNGSLHHHPKYWETYKLFQTTKQIG